MTANDVVNGLFEFAGGASALRNCFQVYKDRKVRGVSLWSAGLFTTWGFWNLYYYPSLGQWASFTGGLVIVTSNVIWLAMALKWRNN